MPDREMEYRMPKDFETLLRQSKMRCNLISWYPLKKGMRVLVVGDNCDSIKDFLEEQEVILTTKDDENKNIFDYLMHLEDMKNQFDVILHIGIPVNDAGQKKHIIYKYLQRYRGLLAECGTLLFAVGNRLGLKYFAGCKDEYCNRYFIGPEGYTEVTGNYLMSKKEYLKEIKDNGFFDVACYYPYPDYFFPTAIYSDERLPAQGEITNGVPYTEKERYQLFDESKVYNSLLKEHVYDIFSNAFIFVCTKETTSKAELPLYVKYSMERAEEYQIRTEILKDEGGTQRVRKYPGNEKAKSHITAMAGNYERLQKLAEGTGIIYSKVECKNNIATFEWAKGQSLQDKIQELLQNNCKEEAERLIYKFVDKVSALHNQDICNIDMIFSNVFVDGEDWTIIDYEWIFEHNIPLKWILYRAMDTLSRDVAGYSLTDKKYLMNIIEVSEEEEKVYAQWEVSFQQHIRGKAVVVEHILDVLKKPVFYLQEEQTEIGRDAEVIMNRNGKRARKIFYHIDRLEVCDGQIICTGWSCAKGKGKELLPTEIKIYDEDGTTIGNEIKRVKREDVAETFHATSDFQAWGFEAIWRMGENKNYILRLNVGKCWQEIALVV